VKQINEEADADEQTVRISIDAKATVKVGPFARGGKSRHSTKAADHDFEPEATVTPVGIFLPAFDEIFFYGVISKVTSDCLVDRLVDWWETVRERFSQIKTIVIHADNGPESHSRRTEVSCSVCWNLLSGIRSPYVSRIIHPIIANTIRSNAVGAF
jgi:Rhodopirellula transposase DDE domain